MVDYFESKNWSSATNQICFVTKLFLFFYRGEEAQEILPNTDLSFLLQWSD